VRCEMAGRAAGELRESKADLRLHPRVYSIAGSEWRGLSGRLSRTAHLQKGASMKIISAACVSLLFLMALAADLDAQTVTGSITGTVVDSAGALVVGADVQLTNQITKQVREFHTSGNGTFAFPDLVPGTYDVRISHPGFKTYLQHGITVGTLEKVDLHSLALDVGDVTTSIQVEAQAARVSTDSSDHSTDVNLMQIQQTPIRGRNFEAIVKALPGVIDTNTYDTRGWGTGNATINGGQQGQVLVTLDGMAAQDSGAPGLNTYQAPSTDAIGEVKLLTGNYAAEYGARNGGQMNITIKNGTNQFHGSAYYYFRNEEFNANEYLNNQLGVVKPRYRYENPGGTFGGPIFIPGVPFNRNRNKLFFFWSYDQLINTQATGINKYTMPSALERQGNFSQSVNANGSPILVRDPNTGQPCSTGSAAGCFPGNIIPASRFSPIGQTMLNLFPQPNTVDPTGQRQYNFTDVLNNSDPRTDKILRIDYNISSKDTMFVRLLQDYQAQSGYGAILGAAGDGWGQFPHSYFIPSVGAAVTYTHIFRPNLINEATVGQNRAHQQNRQTDSALYNKSLLPLKDASGNTINLPTIFGNSVNYLNLLPNVNFGLPSGFSASSAPSSIPNLPSFGFDSRWPFDGTDNLATFTDNITWIKGSHTLKAGFYFEHDARNVSVYSVYNTAGTYYFGSDLGNPVDSGDPFSNALLGSLYGYGQDNLKQVNKARYKQTEWFVQDTWKASRRLTLDIGLRFQRLGALYEAPGQTQGVFEAGAYNPGQQGQLLFPTCTVAVADGGACPTASKASVNPATGALYSYAQQGTFAPGTYNGTPFSGTVQWPSGSKPYFQSPGLAFGPRVGFAYDVFGDGKTAIRGGFGIFYGRAFGVDTLGATGVGIGPLATPPHFLAPIILNSTISGLSNAQLAFTPQTTVGGPLSYPAPSTYDWSFGIQRDLGKGFVADISYVANVAHHQFNQGAINLNAVQPLTDWTPTANNGQPGPVARFLDPTSGNGGTAGFYSTNLIRALAAPFPGWNSIQMYSGSGESYYDSLQAQLNKRVGKRFFFGSNFTWAKTIVYSRDQFVSDQLLKNVASGTGLSASAPVNGGGSRPFAFNLNFGYAVPNGSSLWRNKFTEFVADNWHVEGIITMYSGAPLTISCSANGAPIGYWTGTPDTGGFPFRCQQNGNLWLQSGATPATVGSKASPALWWPFNPASFSLPSANSFGIGNTPPTLTYGPGFNNTDLTVYKQWHVFGEGRLLEVRFQAFNALNHFNPGNPNTLLQLNFANGANTNANFGTITTAAFPARRGVLSARFTF
jgi:hypothetical protein